MTKRYAVVNNHTRKDLNLNYINYRNKWEEKVGTNLVKLQLVSVFLVTLSRSFFEVMKCDVFSLKRVIKAKYGIFMMFI